MIIKKLVLHNFRVFRGVHEVNLEPSRDQHGTPRPIILFGGLNGAGKTSILSAVRTVLYGRQAFSRTLSKGEYIEQLDALIHKGEGLGGHPEQASIELIFTFTQGGLESEYNLIRSWGKGKKDRLSLSQDGTPRSELNYDQCQGFLNELIPAGIADLFFFDGEKIAELAEDESGSILQTAVRRLLGIDLIARLKSDLIIYLKRHGAEAMPEKINQELRESQTERQALEKTAEKLRFDADLKATKFELVSKDLSDLEASLNADGGTWAKTRQSEEERVKDLLKEKVQLEKDIRSELEYLLPLALAPNTLKELLHDLASEAQVKQKQSFGREVQSLYTQLKSALSGIEEDNTPSLQLVDQCFEAHLNEIPVDAVSLDLSDREYRGLEHQVSDAQEQSLPRFQEAKDRLAKVEYELDHASLNIERAPDQEQLQDIFTKIRQLERQRVQLNNDYRQVLEAAKDAFKKAMELAKKEQKLHDKHRVFSNSSEAVNNAQQALLLLDRFAELLTHARVKKLESEFIASYKQLARKDDLQIQARINPATFDVELIDDHDHVINRKALSAGEKQIYAISILEALGRTSGRKLPIIIDTPLGRLDSHHRDKLVKYYFPFASHQVVILSTDTEIDNHYFSKYLEEEISHAYEIVFDGKTKSSRLKEGYFWAASQEEAV
ncbi:DNA sulfur modification protein DndD [Neptunomonas qingdaonensis]|uniref:DNA sulfur modification protein DndD n=1 Tax=Neptunomonas qingdaonensis TaxID=1045558 RepID=A0A1I2TUQ4_9GAMM|nr:DNA sulfur modification protein DndD [Neptunomonas qingdaonensis]SFG68655.1 DNA sulfur modification protein DndD [Neptunomonas qingdaonensis]